MTCSRRRPCSMRFSSISISRSASTAGLAIVLADEVSDLTNNGGGDYSFDLASVGGLIGAREQRKCLHRDRRIRYRWRSGDGADRDTLTTVNTVARRRARLVLVLTAFFGRNASNGRWQNSGLSNTWSCRQGLLGRMPNGRHLPPRRRRTATPLLLLAQTEKCRPGLEMSAAGGKEISPNDFGPARRRFDGRAAYDKACGRFRVGTQALSQRGAHSRDTGGRSASRFRYACIGVEGAAIIAYLSCRYIPRTVTKKARRPHTPNRHSRRAFPSPLARRQ